MFVQDAEGAFLEPARWVRRSGRRTRGAAASAAGCGGTSDVSSWPMNVKRDTPSIARPLLPYATAPDDMGTLRPARRAYGSSPGRDHAGRWDAPTRLRRGRPARAAGVVPRGAGPVAAVRAARGPARVVLPVEEHAVRTRARAKRLGVGAGQYRDGVFGDRSERGGDGWRRRVGDCLRVRSDRQLLPAWSGADRAVHDGRRVAVERPSAGRGGKQRPQGVTEGARCREFGRGDRVEVALGRCDRESLGHAQEPVGQVGGRLQRVELGSAPFEARVRELEGQRLAKKWGRVVGDVLTVHRACNRENLPVGSHA